MFCAFSGGTNPVDNWVNWTLIGLGIIFVIVEVLLGAATGFDLALMGVSLAAGGAVGLAFSSTKVGLFSTGALALLYLAVFRRMIRARLASGGKPSNIDAIMGRTGVVLERIAPNAPGQVKVGDEIWRAVLESESSAPREAGQTVTVGSVDGVTLRVR
jgi:membrane protein implicated in regulation of membrane protease activity